MANNLETVRHLPVFEPHHPLSTNRYLQIRHRRPRRDLHVCVVVGEVDLCTVPLLEQELSLAQRRSVRSVVVDLSAVGFLAAGGVSTLMAAGRRAAARGRSFALVVNTRPIRRVLDLTGISHQLVSYRSLSEALQAHAGSYADCR